LPASLRFNPPTQLENRGTPGTDRRPYLVTVPPRKPATATRKTVANTSQYLALFPHESEDARLTGATRSLYRRLLALNLPHDAAHPELPAELREIADARFKVVGGKTA